MWRERERDSEIEIEFRETERGERERGKRQREGERERACAGSRRSGEEHPRAWALWQNQGKASPEWKLPQVERADMRGSNSVNDAGATSTNRKRRKRAPPKIKAACEIAGGRAFVRGQFKPRFSRGQLSRLLIKNLGVLQITSCSSGCASSNRLQGTPLDHRV